METLQALLYLTAKPIAMLPSHGFDRTVKDSGLYVLVCAVRLGVGEVVQGGVTGVFSPLPQSADEHSP